MTEAHVPSRVSSSTVRLARALVRQARKRGEYESESVERVAGMEIPEDHPRKVDADR